MSTEGILLIGAGGHARVVYDALRASGSEVWVLVRDDRPPADLRFVDCEVRSPIEFSLGEPQHVHVAIGQNHIRLRYAKMALAHSKVLLTVLHPRSTIAQTTLVGAGTFVGAGAIIAPGSTIGTGTIINHAAVVDHDCRIGDFTHVAPHSTLGGGVTVGSEVLVGAGAVVLPGRRIGDRAIVGAGAVVTRDVPEGVTVVGAPAKPSSCHA